MSHLEVRDLELVYQRAGSAVHALNGIALAIPKGQFVCVMGPSGSGKSTLLHILCGLLAPTAGSVRLGGIDVHALSDTDATRYRRRRVGMIFQFFNLVPTLTVERNAALPLLADGARMADVRERVRAALARLGMADRCGHRVSELSGGEMQRVAIARALLPNPGLVLADEPTGSLDSRTGEEILTLLRRGCSEDGVTVVLMTHDPRAAAFSDRLIELEDGRVVSDLLVPAVRDGN